jgi:hypothetical protein
MADVLGGEQPGNHSELQDGGTIAVLDVADLRVSR